MITETDLDNIMVRQKDAILRMINKDRIMEANTMLDTVRELWNLNDYGYKVKEIEKRLKEF